MGAKGELYAWGRADSGQLGVGQDWIAPHTGLGSMGAGSNGFAGSGGGGGGDGGAAPGDGAVQGVLGVCWPARVDSFVPSDDPVAQVCALGEREREREGGGAAAPCAVCVRSRGKNGGGGPARARVWRFGETDALFVCNQWTAHTHTCMKHLRAALV